MKFLVVTSAPTLQKDEKYLAYAPYVIEMDMWFKDVQEVGIISPGSYPDKVFTKDFDRQNIRFFKIPFFKFTISESIILFINSPYILFQILRAFIWADYIHLRGPGNIGLLGCLVQIFFPRKRKTAKYAGNWDPKAKQPWSYKLQKWILSNTFLTRNMKVLVYGKWPNQTKNILPFFTASFNESEKEVIIKDFNLPYKFLFVGGLVAGKQPLFAIHLVEALNKRSIPAELHIYGDGPLKKDLEKKAENKNYIYLHGNQPLEVLKRAYKDSHFLVLASKSEGWPKAVAEAMFFGCIPIAMRVSCVPWMLGGGSRGVLISDGNVGDGNQVDSGNPSLRFGQGGRRKPTPTVRAGKEERREEVLDETVDRIMELLENPDEMKQMSREAQEWSQEYTLERFEEEIKKLLFP